MRAFIDLLDALIGGLRAGFLTMLVIATLLATLAWAVRTRRLSPFGGPGRFSRRFLDPLLVPVERRVIRAGSTSASAPWWALLVVFLVSIAALFAVTFFRDAMVGAYRASAGGVRGIFGLVVAWTFGALQLAILVRVVTSWVGGTHSAVGRLATRLTEWFLAPLRRLLPPFGAMDLSPLIAWFVLSLLAAAVQRLL